MGDQRSDHGSSSPPALHPSPPVTRDGGDIGTRFVKRLLKSINWVVGVEAPFEALEDAADSEDPGKQSLERKVIAAQLLLALYVIDVMQWIVGKVFELEALILADQSSAGIEPVRLAFVLATIESAVEFVADVATPRVYAATTSSHCLASGDQSGQPVSFNLASPRSLAIFALRAYCVAALISATLYPLHGVWLLTLGDTDNRNRLLWSLIVTRSLQYFWFNQLGDAATELGRPNWIGTFVGLTLSFPAVVPSKCCESLQLRRPADMDTTALYLTLLRFALMAIFAVLYSMASWSSFLRWGGAMAMATLTALATVHLTSRSAWLSEGVVEEEPDATATTAPPRRTGPRALWKLRSDERDLVGFVCVAQAAPSQANAALIALAAIRMTYYIKNVVVVLGGMIALYYLADQISRAPKVEAKTFDNDESNRISRSMRPGGIIEREPGKINSGGGPTTPDGLQPPTTSPMAPRQKDWRASIPRMPSAPSALGAQKASDEWSTWLLLVWVQTVLLGGSSLILLSGGLQGQASYGTRTTSTLLMGLLLLLLLPYVACAKALEARIDAVLFALANPTNSNANSSNTDSGATATRIPALDESDQITEEGSFGGNESTTKTEPSSELGSEHAKQKHQDETTAEKTNGDVLTSSTANSDEANNDLQPDPPRRYRFFRASHRFANRCAISQPPARIRLHSTKSM